MALGAMSLAWLTPQTAHAQYAPDCSTPRRAMETFIRNLPDDFDAPADAITCFDFSRFDGGEQAKQEAVIRLKRVLDATGHFVYFDQIPDEPEYIEKESGQARFIPFPSEFPDIQLQKKGDRWVFSVSTVTAVPGLYRQTFALDLERFKSRMPDYLRGHFFGAEIWHWLALLLLIALSIVVSRLCHIILIRAIRSAFKGRQSDFLDTVRERMVWPVSVLIASGLLGLLVPELGLPVAFSRTLIIAFKVMATSSVVLIAYRLIDGLSEFMSSRASKTDTRLDDQLVPLVRKSLKATLTVIGVIFILQNLNVDVGSLLAGLGIGGLAFALAAKDTLANFFGSLMIFVDRPFQIGDWIKMSGVEGTVEEVGFRSTRVRTFYGSLVTVPNSKVADNIIDNVGERQYRRFKMTLSLTYNATPEQIQAFTEGVRAILINNPAVWDQPPNVYFNAMAAHSLDVMVHTFLDVPTWGEELRARHNIQLEIMRLARALGVSFAFPTQSLHIEATPQNPLPTPDPTDNDALIAIVNSFGPQSPTALPQGQPLTPFFDNPEPTERGEGEE